MVKTNYLPRMKTKTTKLSKTFTLDVVRIFLSQLPLCPVSDVYWQALKTHLYFFFQMQHQVDCICSISNLFWPILFLNSLRFITLRTTVTSQWNAKTAKGLTEKTFFQRLREIWGTLLVTIWLCLHNHKFDHSVKNCDLTTERESSHKS